MITFLGEKDRRALGEILADLQRPVHLLLFTTPLGDDYGRMVYNLLHGLAISHARLHLELHDTLADITLILRLELSGLPAILVSNAEGTATNIRFYGLPSGYIFTALLEAVLLVGGAVGATLHAETRAFLARLTQPVHIQIFVTADDQTCPATVVLAHAFAHAGPLIVVDTIEIRAFPELTRRYGVTQTPTMVINEQVVISGEVAEAALLWQLRLVTAESRR